MIVTTLALGLAMISSPAIAHGPTWSNQTVDKTKLSLELPAKLESQPVEPIQDGAPLVEKMSVFAFATDDTTANGSVVVAETSKGFDLSKEVLEMAADGVVEGIKSEIDGKVSVESRVVGSCGSFPAVVISTRIESEGEKITVHVVVIGDKDRWVTLMLGYGDKDEEGQAVVKRVLGSVRYDGNPFKS